MGDREEAFGMEEAIRLQTRRRRWKLLGRFKLARNPGPFAWGQNDPVGQTPFNIRLEDKSVRLAILNTRRSDRTPNKDVKRFHQRKRRFTGMGSHTSLSRIFGELFDRTSLCFG